MTRQTIAWTLGIVFWLGTPIVTQAEVATHPLFSDNGVLQQGITVPVWGTGTDGEKVTVRFGGQTKTATVTGGAWQVQLDKMPAGGPFELQVAGANTITRKNMMVGEVWICSGQSNMQFALKSSAEAEQAIANADQPSIRLFTVPRSSTPEPQSTVDASWQVCTPTTAPDFSAVAYYFGAKLAAELDAPVGLISTNYGGTPAEAWTSKQALDQDADLAAAFAGGATTDPHSPSGLYNGMIHPLLPYAIRGAIWYQGESNAARAHQYRTLFPTMIANWRQDWKQGDFPFLFVQLAPFKPIVTGPVESDWAELREAQLMTLTASPNTAMAVITDVGEENDIHPRKKQPVGERLALGALALAYDKSIEYSGPIYSGMKVDGNRAVLSFDHVGQGLKAEGGELTGFTIAGADKKFVNAQAKIDGKTVVVSSPQVEKPVAVRYGWADYPVTNLWNADGLAASPFRTDDNPGVTVGVTKNPSRPAKKAATPKKVKGKAKAKATTSS